MKETNSTTLMNETFSNIENDIKLNTESFEKKIVVMDKQECIFLSVKNICYVEADGAYSNIYLNDGKRLVVSKNMKVLAERLLGPLFYRIHKSYIINVNFISKYVKSDGGYLVMENGASIPVSIRKRDSFLDLVGTLAL